MPDIPSRVETILESMLGYPVQVPIPESRVEELLILLKEAIEGGGGGGVSDYNDLTSKPSINNVTLQGNKTLADIGIVNPIIIKGRVNTTLDLPSNAEPGWLYFVGLSTDTELKEYVYTTDNRWEFIGYNTFSIDSDLSNSSVNPVQNKVISKALNDKQNAKISNTITASVGSTYDLNNLITIDSYEIKSASVPYIRNLPSGWTGDGRIDVIEMPGDTRRQILRSVSSDTSEYVRNSYINGSSEYTWSNWSLGSASDILKPMSESEYEALATKDKPLYFIYDE